METIKMKCFASIATYHRYLIAIVTLRPVHVDDCRGNPQHRPAPICDDENVLILGRKLYERVVHQRPENLPLAQKADSPYRQDHWSYVRIDRLGIRAWSMRVGTARYKRAFATAAPCCY